MSRTSRLGNLMALGLIWPKTLFWHILHWKHYEKDWQYGRTWIFSLVSSVLHPSFAFPLPSRVEKEFITSSRHPSRRWTSDWSNGECEDSRHTKKKTRVTLKYPHFYLSPLFLSGELRLVPAKKLSIGTRACLECFLESALVYFLRTKFRDTCV